MNIYISGFMPIDIVATLNFNMLKIHFIICEMVCCYLQNVMNRITTVIKTTTLL